MIRGWEWWCVETRNLIGYYPTVAGLKRDVRKSIEMWGDAAVSGTLIGPDNDGPVVPMQGALVDEEIIEWACGD